MEVYFRIKMLDIMADYVRFPSKRELVEMSDADFQGFRSDLEKLQSTIDEVNASMWKAYRAYYRARLTRLESHKASHHIA